MVRWMCDIKVKDRVPSKELRERLGIGDIILFYSKTSCDGMGMCCEKKTVIGCMKWRVPDKEVDQRGLEERLCKRLSSVQIEQGRCYRYLAIWLLHDDVF